MKYMLIAESAVYEKVIAVRDTEEKCEYIAYEMDWEYVDENGFAWDLYVTTEEEWAENHPAWLDEIA